jgi:hypothetical protein
MTKTTKVKVLGCCGGNGTGLGSSPVKLQLERILIPAGVVGG